MFAPAVVAIAVKLTNQTTACRRRRVEIHKSGNDIKNARIMAAKPISILTSLPGLRLFVLGHCLGLPKSKHSIIQLAHRLPGIRPIDKPKLLQRRQRAFLARLIHNLAVLEREDCDA